MWDYSMVGDFDIFCESKCSKMAKLWQLWKDYEKREKYTWPFGRLSFHDSEKY